MATLDAVYRRGLQSTDAGFNIEPKNATDVHDGDDGDADDADGGGNGDDDKVLFLLESMSAIVD